MTLADKLAAHFPPEQVLQRPGRGGGPALDYIEDETVMDRLDEALGVGNWSLLVTPISVADGIVQVRLGAKIEAEWVWYEDFGYANNVSGDALKEAVTDGIRRCGRYLGVGRYLYHKHSSAGSSSTRQSGNGRAAGPPPAARPPARTTTDLPEEPEWLGDADATGTAPTPIRGNPTTGSGWSFKELAEATEAAGLPKNKIYQTADSLFGKDTKVTSLTGPQREQIAFEMGLAG
jgi:hypothetical protein